MSESVDCLRIVAHDAPGLNRIDRALIRKAADDLEAAERACATIYAQLAELTQISTALRERINFFEKRPVTLPFDSISTKFEASMSVKRWTA
jgi:hypothetical protein